MQRVMGIVIVLGLTLFTISGCPKGEYQNLLDAPPDDFAKAQAHWNDYIGALSDKQLSMQSEYMARFFARPVIARVKEGDFASQISRARKKVFTGLLTDVKIKALKQAPKGLALVMDSDVGEIGIPMAKEGSTFKFAELIASTGEWTRIGGVERDLIAVPTTMPQEVSLLYIKMMVLDEEALVGDRLRASVGLAKKQYRHQIIESQRTVTDPIVRLGLGLARTKIDGYDESFIKNFPTNAKGLEALRNADNTIFEEMIYKLSNLSGLVEDPPVNEVMFKIAAHSPESMHVLMGKALYNMAELNPGRFVNAVYNVVKDLRNNLALKIYFDEVRRRKGKAPNLLQFLKEFGRLGIPEERELCRALLGEFKRAI